MKLFSQYITNIEELSNVILTEKKEEINNTNDIKINHIIYITSLGELGKSELKIFKEAIKKYPSIKITYIINFFTYILDNEVLTIKYIDHETNKEKELKIKLTDNLSTMFLYKCIHPDFWNEYMYSFSETLRKNFFLQINPPSISRYANDKYLSYKLLSNYDMPQPKTCVVEKSDINMFEATEDDDVYFSGKCTLINKLGKLYNIDAKDFKDLEDKEFVVKTLNGSHGIGVFLCNGKQILGILQTAFYLDENLKLLVQVKEETIDGDLRVHVLTLEGKQFILAKMKRKKIKSDFRSNYSLGADIEEVELTEEQIQIAKDVARVSGLTWCAVDIMPIKKNEAGQENVIIEYNQNPGVEGISKVMKQNFFNILLDKLFENLSKYDFYTQYNGKNTII